LPAIGDPARFFATLQGQYIDVVRSRAFADHHAFFEKSRDRKPDCRRRSYVRRW